MKQKYLINVQWISNCVYKLCTHIDMSHISFLWNSQILDAKNFISNKSDKKKMNKKSEQVEKWTEKFREKFLNTT